MSFALALKRPPDYPELTERQQWEIDDRLGILDWDGRCPHEKGVLDCRSCSAVWKDRFGRSRHEQGGKSTR